MAIILCTSLTPYAINRLPSPTPPPSSTPPPPLPPFHPLPLSTPSPYPHLPPPPARPLQAHSFELDLDTSSFGEYARGGIVVQVKDKKVLDYKTLVQVGG